jgi:lipoprotein-anchoring transpeptidase ErfK/SrfK
MTLVLAAACIATGSTAVAFDLAGGTGHGAVGSSHHRSRHRADKVTSAPITIPPAPSTTAGGATDAAQSDAPSWVSSVVPPVTNGTPSNITDPSTVATATVPHLPLYASPGAPQPMSTLANPNYLRAALVLLVTGYQPGWIQAYVPVRPNEATAWVPEADVTISSVPDHIVVSLSARQLTLYHDNTAVFQTPVAPGEPSSPTPTGSFYVAYIVKLTDPGGPYGPYALGTSAFSNTYFSFEGGPGQVGIHGTDQPWVIGSYASHGCVRLPNAAISTVAQQILPGTPVEIFP